MYKQLFKNIYIAIHYQRFDADFIKHCQILLRTIYLHKRVDDIYYLIQFLLLLKNKKNLLLLEISYYVESLIKRSIDKDQAEDKLLYYTSIINCLKFEEVIMLKACSITFFYYT